MQFAFNVTMKVRDRLELIASTPEACAPRTPDVPHNDANTPSFSDRIGGPVFHRVASCIEPAARDLHPDRD